MTGLLLIQLGTPDAPTYRGLFPYLRQFLSDRRVIEVQRAKWLPLLYGIILPTRSGSSAAKYRRIWDPVTGSPLMHYTKRQTELLKPYFPGETVRFGMMVGNPPVRKAVSEMVAAGVRVFVGGLEPIADSKSLKARPDGEVLITDGPYLETKEHVGGFWVLEASSREEALEWGRKAVIACRAPVEIRRFN